MDLMTNPEKFCQVNFYHLENNTKYIITDLVGIFHYVGWFNNYRTMGNDMAVFKNVVCTSPYPRPCGYVNFSYSVERKFYILISKKKQIQDAMESRALNKVLKKITGEELFTWQ
jgi:hypothetical protein